MLPLIVGIMATLSVSSQVNISPTTNSFTISSAEDESSIEFLFNETSEPYQVPIGGIEEKEEKEKEDERAKDIHFDIEKSTSFFTYFTKLIASNSDNYVSEFATISLVVLFHSWKFHL